VDDKTKPITILKNLRPYFNWKEKKGSRDEKM
jgi:hypothetical protein